MMNVDGAGKKTPWFRIHLSTAVVLMLVGAGLALADALIIKHIERVLAENPGAAKNFSVIGLFYRNPLQTAILLMMHLLPLGGTALLCEFLIRRSTRRHSEKPALISERDDVIDNTDVIREAERTKTHSR